ncbi:MAG: phosphoribosylglycinamide formyltransferase [Cocleimonas sp.]
MYKIVVLISGNGSNLQAIIDQINSGEIKAEISAVISNRADAYGLVRAEKENIKAITLDHKQFKDRPAFDQSLLQIIDNYKPQLVLLAGFMRILGDDFVAHYKNRLINIHPSLLPKYKGLHTHKRALKDKQKEHGASVHFVIPELDAGPVILQGIIPIKENDNEETLAKRVHLIEHIIYPQAVKELVEGRVKTEKIYLQ